MHKLLESYIDEIAQNYAGNITTAPMDCSRIELDEFGLFREKREPPKPTTNADRIRAISDEELATVLRGCPDSVEVCPNIPCADCWLDWLRQEAPP